MKNRLVPVKSLGDKEVLASVVFFGATSWCIPCKSLKPIMEDLSNKYTGLSFYYIDADDSPEEFFKHKVRSVPTVKLFINGDMKRELFGALPKSTYENLFNEYVEKED